MFHLPLKPNPVLKFNAVGGWRGCTVAPVQFQALQAPHLGPFQTDGAAPIGRQRHNITAVGRLLQFGCQEDVVRRDCIASFGERALRAAARMHRENGEEWLATQAEARIGA